MATVQTITKSVTLSPGESFNLPNGATVISITDVLSNSCDFPLPDPEALVNYNFIFSINEDDNDDHPVGGTVNIESILINNISTNLAFSSFNTDNTGNSGGVSTWNSQVSASNNLLGAYPVKFVSVNFSSGNSKSDLITAIIRMPESYLSKVFLKITNNKFPNGFYVNGSL